MTPQEQRNKEIEAQEKTKDILKGLLAVAIIILVIYLVTKKGGNGGGDSGGQLMAIASDKMLEKVVGQIFKGMM
jgi:hypothetical protein